MSEENKGWAITMGFYPGVLIGARSYYAEDMTTHVFYLPFLDVAFQIER